MIRFQTVELHSRVCFCQDRRILIDISVKSIMLVPWGVVTNRPLDELLIPEIFLQ
jgi:hypothetical protein